jgi:hypothetical protein
MLYNSTSLDEVIARIIRNTRVQDSSYLLDMVEWIPEAMGQMKTRYETVALYKDITINFHKGKLPCGEIYIDAVQYGCTRLPYSSTVKHYATGHSLSTPDTTEVFTSVVETKTNTANENNIFWTSTQEAVKNCTINEYDWFAIEMGWITTSFADGVVRLYYRSQPLDDNGFPLIPDNENYKQAIYWYVRAMMIGAGFKDQVYNEADLMRRFETYARRAINEITYPTPEEKEQQLKVQVRLIPPSNYYENFYRVDNHEPIFNP